MTTLRRFCHNPSTPMSQRSRTVLKLLFSLALLVIVLSQVDLEKFSETLSSLNPAWVFLAFSLQLLSAFPAVQRWSLILRNFEVRVGFLPLLRLALIGNFFNLFLPTGIGGDFIRAFYLSRKVERGVSSILTTILLERSSGLCALLLIGTVSSALSDLEVSGFRAVYLFLMLLAGYTLINLLLFLPWIHTQLDLLLKSWGFESIAAKLELIYRGLQTLRRDGRALGASLIFSLIVQIDSILVMWILAQAIGVTTPFSTFLVFIPLINLTLLIPLTISGFGLREGAYLLLFSSLPAEVSITLSLLNYVVLLLAGLPGALFYTLLKKEEHFTRFTTRTEVP